MRKRDAIIGLVILAAVVLLVLFINVRREVTHPPASEVPHRETTISSFSSATSQAPSPGTIATRRMTESPVTNRAQEIVSVLLLTKPGRLTTKEAHQLIKELVASPNFESVANSLLSSQQVAERLLGVYALLESRGLTSELRGIAMSDSSPYVRAEITNWLFRKQQFDNLEQIMRATVGGMSEDILASLVLTTASSPQAEVPAVLSRLDIGEGLPRYLALIAENSEVAATAVSEALGDVKTSAAGKKLLLQIMATVRPPGYEAILLRRFEAEPTLSTRTRLAQNLAASISETNTQERTRIESRLPMVQPGLAPMSLQYREQRMGQLNNLENDLREMCQKENPDPLYVQTVLAEYIKIGRILGKDSISPQILKLVCDTAQRLKMPSVNESIAEASFELYRLKYKSNN